MISTETKQRMTLSQATSRVINLILSMSPDEIIETLHEIEDRKRISEAQTRTEVVFAVDKRFCKGMASIITPHGLFIETQERFSSGEVIILTFENRKEGRQVKTSGTVTRVDPEGIEVEFSREAETES